MKMFTIYNSLLFACTINYYNINSVKKRGKHLKKKLIVNFKYFTHPKIPLIPTFFYALGLVHK